VFRQRQPQLLPRDAACPHDAKNGDHPVRVPSTTLSSPACSRLGPPQVATLNVSVLVSIAKPRPSGERTR
jgi:hypothetical protein